jgi:1-acyl-sn-glycerol-3-phosphate acyltransferase
LIEFVKYITKLILICFVTVYYSIYVLLAMMISGKQVFHLHARNWSTILIKITGVKLTVNDNSGREGKSYIYIANHSSLFDIPVLLSTLKDNARIIYKEELEKIPIFGWCLKMSPFISVKRDDPKNALKGFREAVKSISEGDSVIIFPEGTRSPDGKLGEFKKGAFLMAEKSKKVIVPVVIHGTSTIMPKGKLKFGTGNVILNIHPKIDSTEFGKISGKKLIDEVWEIFNNENNL